MKWMNLTTSYSWWPNSLLSSTPLLPVLLLEGRRPTCGNDGDHAGLQIEAGFPARVSSPANAHTAATFSLFHSYDREEKLAPSPLVCSANHLLRKDKVKDNRLHFPLASQRANCPPFPPTLVLARARVSPTKTKRSNYTQRRSNIYLGKTLNFPLTIKKTIDAWKKNLDLP